MLKHAEDSSWHMGNVKMSLNWEAVRRIAYIIERHPEELQSIFQDILTPLSNFYCTTIPSQ